MRALENINNTEKYVMIVFGNSNSPDAVDANEKYAGRNVTAAKPPARRE